MISWSDQAGINRLVEFGRSQLGSRLPDQLNLSCP